MSTLYHGWDIVDGAVSLFDIALVRKGCGVQCFRLLKYPHASTGMLDSKQNTAMFRLPAQAGVVLAGSHCADSVGESRNTFRYCDNLIGPLLVVHST